MNKPELTLLDQRRRCLDHARDLLACAQRVLANDNGYPNIAYHLAILAMEEVGKAGMLSARAVTRGALDGSWIDKHLDDHAAKLTWAVWSPSMLGGKIDPKHFESAREFAQSTHERRLAGLYVDYAENSTSPPPREAVRVDQATSLVSLAGVRLELEEAQGAPILDGSNEDLAWFLATVSDEEGRKRLFSRPFIQKLEELREDNREWVRWARNEFQMIAAKEKAHLQRELSRTPNERNEGKPKWLMKVRVRTPSHSFSQKTLNYWNERIPDVQLRMAGQKLNELVLDMTFREGVSIKELFEYGLWYSRLHLVMLNIGSRGLFWFEFSGQTSTYYDSIRDLETTELKVSVTRPGSIAKEWSYENKDGKIIKRIALEKEHLSNAIRSLFILGPISPPDAGAIFGPYCDGLTLLSKSDLHLSVEGQARDSFRQSLRAAMRRFGDLSDDDEDVVPCLHRVMQTMVPDEVRRNALFMSVGGDAKDWSITDAITTKQVADLYLTLVTRRLWPDFVARANGELQGESP